MTANPVKSPSYIEFEKYTDAHGITLEEQGEIWPVWLASWTNCRETQEVEGVCAWCGLSFGLVSPNGDGGSHKAAADHMQKCPEHPLNKLMPCGHSARFHIRTEEQSVCVICLASSQASDYDRFWAAMGVLSEDVTVDQAIQRWQALEAAARALVEFVDGKPMGYDYDSLAERADDLRRATGFIGETARGLVCPRCGAELQMQDSVWYCPGNPATCELADNDWNVQGEPPTGRVV